MPADILLYAIIAAGLIFWLKTIIGTTDEDDPVDQGTKKRESEESNFLSPVLGKEKPRSDNVTRLNALSGRRLDLPAHVKFDNKTAENALEDIALTHPDFDLSHFLSGAEQAFSLVVEAFAEGDLDTLQDLLAKPVYETFAAAVKARKKSGESLFTAIQSVDRMEIVEAAVRDKTLFIAVRFHAREIHYSRDKEGNIISGDPDRITSMVDVWVFGQPENESGPEWYLYETRDDEEEDHKTPVPEAGDAPVKS
jgi:predicted lipid-binding transport protein (Tim44 family)